MIVKVKANARKTQILSQSEDELVVAVKAKPENNAANEELVKFLSKHFHKPVKIISGKSSPKKHLIFS